MALMIILSKTKHGFHWPSAAHPSTENLAHGAWLICNLEHYQTGRVLI